MKNIILKSPNHFYDVQDKYPDHDTNHCPFCDDPDVKYHIHREDVTAACNNCRNTETVDLDDLHGLERMFLRWSKEVNPVNSEHTKGNKKPH